MLWTAAVGSVVAFLIALEFLARHYGVLGPVTDQVREVVFAPKSWPLLYGCLALAAITLPWRQRFLALGAALGIDLVFLLVRWICGAQQNFGSGALWVVLACGVIAVTRRTGRDRTLLLKGVGLGLLLVAGRKAGYTWLFITSETRLMVLDQYVALADHALGSPSWVVGRLVRASGTVGFHVLEYVYIQLAGAAVLVSLYQLRNVAAEGRFPRHHLVRTFLAIGALGPAFYLLYPVVGPIYAYGADGGVWAMADLWPNTPTPTGLPQPMPFDGITPRNCMPSLHTAWATAIFIHSRQGPRWMRYGGTFWLAATLTVTLGFGYHYGADLIAGVVFTLTIEAALRAQARGWDRSATWLTGYGAVVFAGLLAAYRYLPVEMAAHPWAAGPLLLLALGSVIRLYVRTTRQWESGFVPAQRTGPAVRPGLSVPAP
ncbi:phosphatase PAP2 family protein [Streptomyces polyrhachis]|uniref:Phosphatase PAP2 family protein n=1 Tax=Streptomyces polyrhachis TaxID=1282885 RepID=A0ABW2GMC5_9ACTN